MKEFTWWQAVVFRLGIAIPVAIAIYVLANAFAHPMEFWVAYLLGLGVVILGVDGIEIVIEALRSP